MKSQNPFPGMNPWLQNHWRGFHASFLTYVRDTLNEQLPDGMTADIDERVAISDAALDADAVTYLPDVAVMQSWDHPAGVKLAGVAVAEPRIVDAKDEFDSFVAIMDSNEHIITAIELLSPSNKGSLKTRDAWRQKRKDCVTAGISMVEIDLVRGSWILPGREALPKPLPADRVVHGVCITRSFNRRQHELYDLPMREALPAIGIPLRETDQDAKLELQQLVDQCYSKGRYGERINYRRQPDPPLPQEEVEWTDGLLKQANLI